MAGQVLHTNMTSRADTEGSVDLKTNLVKTLNLDLSSCASSVNSGKDTISTAVKNPTMASFKTPRDRKVVRIRARNIETESYDA